MGLIEDLVKFLEMRLDAFLQAHPDLELQALEEQLRQQEADTNRLLNTSRSELSALEKQIMTLAEDVKVWHGRIDQAVAAGRSDLAEAARDREANLLQTGNQLWGQMQGLKTRIAQMQQLLQQVQVRKQELSARIAAQPKAAKTEPPASAQWSQASNNRDWSKVENAFQQLEIEQELERLKQKRR